MTLQAESALDALTTEFERGQSKAWKGAGNGTGGDGIAGNGMPEQLGEWDFGAAHITAVDIPPRGWLLGNLFCRKSLSCLLGDGGVGKTALRIACALSLATGRELIGEHVFARSRVLYLCFEDGEDELKRRIFGAMKHHGIADCEIEDWLFVRAITRSDWKIAIGTPNGQPAVGGLLKMVKAAIVNREIDAVIFDPFIKTHTLSENDNNALDFVAGLLANLAIDQDVAVDCTHHTRKGPADPGNADAGRGASSFKDAARLVYSLCVMSTDEAEWFGVPDKERRRLIRLDSAKVNIAPPAEDAKWFELVSVAIGNGTQVYPAGDKVQVVTCWDPPSAWTGISNSVANAILDDIDAGLARGTRYSDSNAATARAAYKVVIAHMSDKSAKQAKQIIKTWVKAGVLNHQEYKDPGRRTTAVGLYVNQGKRPT